MAARLLEKNGSERGREGEKESARKRERERGKEGRGAGIDQTDAAVAIVVEKNHQTNI